MPKRNRPKELPHPFRAPTMLGIQSRGRIATVYGRHATTGFSEAGFPALGPAFCADRVCQDRDRTGPHLLVPTDPVPLARVSASTFPSFFPLSLIHIPKTSETMVAPQTSESSKPNGAQSNYIAWSALGVLAAVLFTYSLLNRNAKGVEVIQPGEAEKIKAVSEQFRECSSRPS